MKKEKAANQAVLNFSWGPIVHVHQIGDVLVIENNPQIFKNSCGTGRYDKTKTEFHPYLFSKGEYRSISVCYHTLDLAMVGAIAHKYDGSNTRAELYFAKMVGIKL